MAEENIKNAAKNVVDDVLNGANTKINRALDGNKCCQRSLLCVLFNPSMYLCPHNEKECTLRGTCYVI